MSLAADRGWMYDVEDTTDRFLSHTFCSNLYVFLDYAFSNKAFVDNNRIKCPCLECDNKHFKIRNDVMFHLYEKGFTPNYTTWSAHGETSTTFRHEGESRHPIEGDNDCKRMVVNEMDPTNVEKLLESIRRYTYMADAMSVAHRYILFNCGEVKPFIRLYDDLIRQQQPNIDEWGRDIL
nr:transposon, En/Spm-like, transposase-associated domain protein [Tanacetum cinerariifolium]